MPLTPGRSIAVDRELIPLGTEASAALMVAFDTEIQEGRFDPDGLAPLARLLGAGDVVFRADLQYERFRTPRPPDRWAVCGGPPGRLQHSGGWPPTGWTTAGMWLLRRMVGRDPVVANPGP